MDEFDEICTGDRILFCSKYSADNVPQQSSVSGKLF